MLSKRAQFRLNSIYGNYETLASIETDLEQVRGLLGHTRIETTQVYAQIQPEQLKQSVSFYEARALDALTT